MNAEQGLHDLVDERVRAVRERDSATLAARPVEDVITFDVLPPLNARGSQSTAEHLHAWFDGYDGPIDCSRSPGHPPAANEPVQAAGRAAVLAVIAAGARSLPARLRWERRRAGIGRRRP